MLCCIQNVIEKTLLMSERIIVFIDYSKAFESISHIQMFNILNDMGFPRHIVAHRRSMRNKRQSYVGTEHTRSLSS